MKRAIIRVLLNENGQRGRCDVMLYIDNADGKPRRHAIAERVPRYYAECAARGAHKALEAIGYEVGEKP